MRDIAVLAFMFALVPLALANTFNAYLLWCWMGLIALNGYLYGYMAAVPFVQVFALIALARILVNKDAEYGKPVLDSAFILFLLFLIHGILSAIFAYPGLIKNWELFNNMLKTILFCLLMPFMIKSRFRIHALVLIIAMGVGFHGLLDGLKFIASAGGHQARGIVKFGDNNHYAMVMVMVLPLLVYVYMYSAKKIVRVGSIASIILVSSAVIATNSRGGLLSLTVMALWIVLTGRRKIMGLITMTALAVLMLQLAPDKWFERMDTIQSANQDLSFMGRVTAWKRASAIAIENPIFGGGFHAGQAHSIFEQFRYKQGLLGMVATPDIYYPAATHSIYFEVLGDLGFIGLFLFLACLANGFITASKIKNFARQRGDSHVWASDLANCITASLVAYCVGGAALSAAYFDLPYILLMLLAVLNNSIQDNFAKK